MELTQTVRTKSKTPHSNLCKHGKYFFRTFWTVDALHMGFGAQKISKKGHGSKKESFIDCSFNSASLARHKNKNKKNKNYLTTMLQCFANENLWHRLTSNCTRSARNVEQLKQNMSATLPTSPLKVFAPNRPYQVTNQSHDITYFQASPNHSLMKENNFHHHFVLKQSHSKKNSYHPTLISVALPDTHRSFRTCCRHEKA